MSGLFVWTLEWELAVYRLLIPLQGIKRDSYRFLLVAPTYQHFHGFVVNPIWLTWQVK